MEIWLKHPNHGVKCAHLVSEAEQDEKNGWARFDFRSEIAAPKAMENEELVGEEPQAEMQSVEPIQAQKKRGRKPKNRG